MFRLLFLLSPFFLFGFQYAYAAPAATGATETRFSNSNGSVDVVQSFTRNGSLTIPAGESLSGARVLVIGGGGGGGRAGAESAAGGGGAGGFQEQTGVSLAAGTYTVTVGAGGAGGLADGFSADLALPGSDGGNSSFSGPGSVSITANGGGGGGGGSTSMGGSGLTNAHGRAGGSGGGGAAREAAGNAGAGTSGQGSNGGAGAANANTSSQFSGGGGGAGAVGQTGTGTAGGAGGAGKSSSIAVASGGTAVVYAGGGGGGRRGSGTPGAGGTGGGGTGGGGSANATPGNGTDGLGGGGGGAGAANAANRQNGGNGGKGIVIVRYTLSPNQLRVSTQPVAGTSGGRFSTPPAVEILDSSGNRLTGSSASVTARINSGTGGTLGGTLTVAAVNGVATFSDLTLTGLTSNRYTLEFTHGGASVTSSNVNLTGGGAATKLAILRQPAAGGSGAALVTQPVIEVQDALGNRAIGSSATVTVAINSGSEGALGGSLSVQASGGVATFSNVSMRGLASHAYTLEFTSGSLTPVTSAQISPTTASLTGTSGIVNGLTALTIGRNIGGIINQASLGGIVRGNQGQASTPTDTRPASTPADGAQTLVPIAQISGNQGINKQDYGRLYILSVRDGGRFSLTDWYSMGVASSSVSGNLNGSGTYVYALLGSEMTKNPNSVSGMLYGLEGANWTFDQETDVRKAGFSVGYYAGYDFGDTAATLSTIATASSNKYTATTGATANTISTRLMITSSLRGMRQFPGGATFSPFVNALYATESTPAVEFDDGVVSSDKATSSIGQFSFGVEHTTASDPEFGRLLIRGQINQTFGAETVTLSNGETYTPNTRPTGAVTFGWISPPEADVNARIELNVAELGNSEGSEIRLDGTWDRPF